MPTDTDATLPEAEPTTKWYEDESWGFDPDEHLPTVSRYDTRQAFGRAFFEQRKKISEQIAPLDLTQPPEKYLPELKAARLRLGAHENSEDYKLVVPDDLQETMTNRLPTFVEDLKKEAAEFGLTDVEFETLATRRLEDVRTILAAETKAADEATREKNERTAQMEELYERIWGKSTPEHKAHAVQFAKHYDDTLFVADNESLSEEERGEKGGRLVQLLRSSDNPLLYRLFASLHGKLLAEPGTPDTSTMPAGGGAYAERLRTVKAMYPKRPELWDQLASDPRVEL